MKKNKKVKVLGLASLVTLLGLGSIIAYSPKEKDNTSILAGKTDQIAIYIEGENGYEFSTSDKFPTKGYVLNTTKSTCENGGTVSQDAKTKSISLNVNHTDQCSIYFDYMPFSEQIITSSNGVKTDFDDPALTDEGIFEMEDDYGTSYYYRGAVENNYVKFGKNKSGQDMYWRIIRVNGDGSLRIMYTGTQAYANGTDNSDMFIGENVWNFNRNDAKYVGWMYGGTSGVASTSKEQAQTNETDSYIKTQVDAWYKTNIVNTGYSDAVADVLFCNDRTTPGRSVSKYANDTGLGYGTNITSYGAWTRFLTGNNTNSVYYLTNITPTFKCPEKNDAFTVDDTTKGNGDLTYPVGLITADEVAAAGSGRMSTSNDKYYLYRPGKDAYWTFSPYNISGNPRVFSVNSKGALYTDGGYGVASVHFGYVPVINLSAEYSSTLIGTGTATDPYRKATVENPEVV